MKTDDRTHLNWQNMSAYSVDIPIAWSTVTLKVNSWPGWRWSGSSSSLVSLETELSPLPLSASPTSSSSLTQSFPSVWPSTTRSSCMRICWFLSSVWARRVERLFWRDCVPNRSSSNDIRADCLTPLEYSLFSSSGTRSRPEIWCRLSLHLRSSSNRAVPKSTLKLQRRTARIPVPKVSLFKQAGALHTSRMSATCLSRLHKLFEYSVR